MALISTENNTELMMTYYDSVFLERFKEVLVLDKWTDKKNIPLWRGKTVNYFSYYPLAGTSTPITEGASTANEATIAGQTIEATILKYAQWSPYTERLKLTSRDKNLVGAVELFGEAAGKSLEELLAEELFKNGSIPIRSSQLSNSATYTIEGRAETSAAASSTTVFHDSALTQTTGFFDGAHVAGIYKATTNYRYGGIVSSHDSTDDLITMTVAAPSIFNNGFYYRMVVGTGIAASQPITGTALNYAVAKARENKFYTFEGGMYKCSLAAQVEYDLQKDPVYRNLAQYQQGQKIEKGYIGNLWGVEINRATMPYRESVAGVKDMDNGVVFCTPIMGRHALGNVGLGGMRGHKIRFKIPGLQTTNEPYDERGTIGYKFYAAPKALNAAFCINLMSGATGVT